ncbi:MAG: hypothetical protein WDO13_07905 [Verrucomicrobiota bacterium]
MSYDYKLHTPFPLGASQQMPEIKFHFGQTHAEMMSWLADYATFYYEEPPEWTFKTVWGHGLAWTNQPTWTDQADFWDEQLEKGICNGIGYSLVTNRPVLSGTTPLGYEPDPNHGSRDEFKAMCHRMADKGVPILIWMSHTGLQPGGVEIDDDWFIRGIDGRVTASWGSIDGGMAACNPGHPGYIEYTKRWIRFYLRECRCKGIFFDCLGWTFPCDFRPRDFMRYPGDTNRMAIKFIEEIYACIKECDPRRFSWVKARPSMRRLTSSQLPEIRSGRWMEWGRATSSCNSTLIRASVSSSIREAAISPPPGCPSA